MKHRAVDEWLALLAPAFRQPLRQVEDLINADPELQQWLQEAAFQAAMEASWQSDPYALSAAYQRLQDELKARFGELAEAIARITHGLGRLRLNWQPDAPHYSRVEIDFGRDYTVDLFMTLTDPLRDALQRSLERLRALIPLDDPYPRRPHQATALLFYQGQAPALRLLDHLTPAGRQQTAIIFLTDRKPSSEMPPETALQVLHAYLSGTSESDRS
ncbi:hypothetical protein [Rhodothermus marinus]|uniref:Uncharacterized protein n=1 Tax=Rhodothermus marinus (strain ATCC 43812 / DSM 4252 / R-10) TaxID=518766 RepID=D0MJX4_RHOM4|nr:hypothetical protein [Rhodothermus marinus]ACY48782.1 hypothetical protein Rmar_1899 [Rhodothermus marinus DSM 4252]